MIETLKKHGWSIKGFIIFALFLSFTLGISAVNIFGFLLILGAMQGQSNQAQINLALVYAMATSAMSCISIACLTAYVLWLSSRLGISLGKPSKLKSEER